MPSIDGLATGIDTTTIINGLLSIQQGQIDTLNVRKQTIIAEQTAFSGIEARLLSLQSKLSDLTRADSNAFRRKTITSSDETVITASVSNDAAAGVYAIRVNNLAKNHQVASQTYESADAQVAKGDLTLTVGEGESITIKVTSANNTLEGMASAINVAARGVTASVVRGNDSYRLLLASNKSGESNAMQISFTALDGGEASIATSFDLDNPVQAATDAEIQVGSGDGAIITSVSSNQVDDLFTGITLDIHKATAGDEILLTVANDTEAARTAITDFIDAYNEVLTFTSDQNKYDPNSQTASTLFGNRTLLNITAKLNILVTQSLPGVDGKDRPNSLKTLGIDIDKNGSGGRLSINEGRLSDALKGTYNNNTINASDITAVFGYAGTSDSDFVRFISASSKTQMSPMRSSEGTNAPVPYQVKVTRAAQQGKLIGTNVLADSVVIDDSNNQLTLSVDGTTSKDLKLRAGTYTPQELADELELQINSNDALAGRQVRASIVEGKISLTSLTYGLSSAMKELSGSALSALGLTGSESVRGENIACDLVLELDSKN